MTSLPAGRVGLKQRGKIKPGYYADLVVFDPEKIIDKATFTEPHQYPEGIHYVFINGTLAIDKGKFLNQRPGQVLRRSHHSHSTVYPGEKWQKWKTPEAAGWSNTKIDEAKKYADSLKTEAVMVVLDGKILTEW